MYEEKDLFVDIIKLCPINSNWSFTYSLQEMEHHFKDITRFNSGNKTTLIIIDENTKSFLLKKLEDVNFHEWIIHQTITDEHGKLLFKSYDHMSTSIIYSNFPQFEALISKYKETDFLEYVES